MSKSVVDRIIKNSNLSDDDKLRLPLNLYYSIQDEIVRGRYKGVKIEIPRDLETSTEEKQESDDEYP